jgi:hypothetical protein
MEVSKFLFKLNIKLERALNQGTRSGDSIVLQVKGE